MREESGNLFQLYAIPCHAPVHFRHLCNQLSELLLIASMHMREELSIMLDSIDSGLYEERTDVIQHIQRHVGSLLNTTEKMARSVAIQCVCSCFERPIWRSELRFIQWGKESTQEGHYEHEVPTPEGSQYSGVY